MSQAAGSTFHVESGFTLIELLVALAVAAGLMSVVWPMLGRSSDQMQLEASVRETMGILRLTRSAAIARNRELTVVIDAGRRTLTSQAGTIRRLPKELQLNAIVADTERRSKTQGGLRFYPDGSSSGGDVTFRVGERLAHICVDWFSGLVTMAQDVPDKPRRGNSGGTAQGGMLTWRLKHS